MTQLVNDRRRMFWVVSWLLAGWIAWELFYYEQFKLNASEGSVQGVFQPLADWFGLPRQEAVFRWAVALLEIMAATLVINQPTRWFGALMTMGLMGGAVFLHAFGPIGIDPYNDGAVLFKEACFTLLVSLALFVMHREDARAFISVVRSPARV